MSFHFSPADTIPNMLPRTRFRTASRWALTFLTISLTWAFLFCTYREILCANNGRNVIAMVKRGYFGMMIARDGRSLLDTLDGDSSGTCFASWSDEHEQMEWWFRVQSNARSIFIIVPLWLPALIAAAAGATLWRRDRHLFSDRWRRFTRPFIPAAPLSFQLRRVLIFAGLNAVVTMSAIMVFSTLTMYLFPRIVDRELPAALASVAVIVFVFGSPLWGIFWAWLWVRWRNSLLRRARPNACVKCGYDLTGNTSGRCPECGGVMAAPLGP